MSSPCGSCTKRCCSNYTVSIIGYDAWVIGTGLRLSLHSVLVYFPIADPPGAAQKDRGFLLAPGGPRHEIALDKVGKFQKGNPCVFWIALANDRGRCGIYAHRPFVCQTYPAYQHDDTVLLRDDVLCPEGSWNLTGMDLPVFRDRLFRFRVEHDVYGYVVTRWNRTVEAAGPRTIHAYYTYLMNVYDALDRFRRSVPEQRLAATVETWARLDASQPNPLLADWVPAAERDVMTAVIDGIRGTVDRLTDVVTESEEAVRV